MTSTASSEDLIANFAAVIDGLADAARRATTVSEQALDLARDAVEQVEARARTTGGHPGPRAVALRGRLHEIDSRAATLTALDEVTAALALLPPHLGLDTPARTSAASLAAALGGCRFAYRDEDQLQAAIAAALTAAGHDPRREVRLSESDRIDLLVDDVGIEVKLAGTTDRLFTQLTRYAASGDVRELLVVTTRARHRALPVEAGGKPLVVLHLGGAR